MQSTHVSAKPVEPVSHRIHERYGEYEEHPSTRPPIALEYQLSNYECAQSLDAAVETSGSTPTGHEDHSTRECLGGEREQCERRQSSARRLHRSTGHRALQS